MSRRMAAIHLAKRRSCAKYEKSMDAFLAKGQDRIVRDAPDRIRSLRNLSPSCYPLTVGNMRSRAAGIGKEQNRQTLLIDFASANKKGRLELQNHRPDDRIVSRVGRRPTKDAFGSTAITYECSA